LRTYTLFHSDKTAKNLACSGNEVRRSNLICRTVISWIFLRVAWRIIQNLSLLKRDEKAGKRL
jgi:hypothetical protein